MYPWWSIVRSIGATTAHHRSSLLAITHTRTHTHTHTHTTTTPHTPAYAVEPEWWDEDDDGPWEAGLVEATAVKDFDWETMRIKGWWRWSHEFPLLAAENSGW